MSERTVTLWLWIFPITYVIHIAEEYFLGGGYSAYLQKLRGVHLSTTRFLVAQGIGVVLMTIGVILAKRFRFQNMLIVILGGTVLVNGITHSVTSITHGGYGPGLITSGGIWIPLGLATLYRFKAENSSRRYWSAVAIGVGINAVISVLTMRGGRIV
ncbi:MAG: HXXEE domain-containing protein [bacterium]